MSWRDRASCLETANDLFFPIGSTGPAVGQIEEAKRVCSGCPVRLPCLEWAIEFNVDYGVWGGLSEEERRSQKRRRTRKRPTPVVRPVVRRLASAS